MLNPSPSTFSDFYRIGARLCACDYVAFCGIAFCAGAKKAGYSVRLTDTPEVFVLLDQDGQTVPAAAIDIEDFDPFDEETDMKRVEDEAAKVLAGAVSLYCRGEVVGAWEDFKEFAAQDENLFKAGCRSVTVAEHIAKMLGRAID